jgi:AraC-like DNA-binding protein
LSRHHHREILIPLKGKYVFGYNGKYYNAEPGTLFFIDHKMEHEQLYTKNSSSFTHLWLFVEDDKILGNCLNIDKNGVIDYSGKIRIVFRDFSQDMSINAVWNELKDAAGENVLLKRRKLLLCLSWIFIKIIEQGDVYRPDLDVYQNEVIASSKKYIRKNFKSGLDVARLARLAGYSKFHYLRMFKKISGFTVYEYINLCRENEVELLVKRNYTQKEIADELGFSCPAAFANWRRKNLKKSS